MAQASPRRMACQTIRHNVAWTALHCTELNVTALHCTGHRTGKQLTARTSPKTGGFILPESLPNAPRKHLNAGTSKTQHIFIVLVEKSSFPSIPEGAPPMPPAFHPGIARNRSQPCFAHTWATGVPRPPPRNRSGPTFRDSKRIARPPGARRFLGNARFIWCRKTKAPDDSAFGEVAPGLCFVVPNETGVLYASRVPSGPRRRPFRPRKGPFRLVSQIRGFRAPPRLASGRPSHQVPRNKGSQRFRPRAPFPPFCATAFSTSRGRYAQAPRPFRLFFPQGPGDIDRSAAGAAPLRVFFHRVVGDSARNASRASTASLFRRLRPPRSPGGSLWARSGRRGAALGRAGCPERPAYFGGNTHCTPLGAPLFRRSRSSRPPRGLTWVTLGSHWVH